ncbi:hypothetical protein ACFX1S_020178 [Malus domestica]
MLSRCWFALLYTQADPYLKGVVIPVHDRVPESESGLDPKVMQVKEALYSLNSLEIKLKLQQEKLSAMELKDTVQRLDNSLEFVKDNISMVAAKLAIQSVEMQFRGNAGRRRSAAASTATRVACSLLNVEDSVNGDETGDNDSLCRVSEVECREKYRQGIEGGEFQGKRPLLCAPTSIF